MANTTPSPSRPPLARLATRSALWAGFSQYFLFGLGFVKIILLSRLISVEYFNLIAVASVWASYFTFTRLDLRVAVMSSNEEPAVLNTQFWLETISAALGLILAGVLFLVWPRMVSQRGAWLLIFALLLVIMFETLTSTPMYLLEKRLRQDVLGRLTIFSSLIGFIVPVTLALNGAPLAAVVADSILPVLIVNIGAFLFIRWRPTFTWDRGQAREQLRLGWTILSTGILGRIIFQFDDWLVSNLNRPNLVPWRAAGGDLAEGYYSRAYNTGKMPMDVAAGMIGRIALSLYAEGAARGREVLQKAYRQLTWLLAWIIFASSAVAFVAADEIVMLLLGARWLPMVPLFRLMFLFIVGRPFFQNNAQLLLALRAERDFHRTVVVQAVFMLIACPPAVHWWGAAGASAVVSVMTVIGMVASEWYVIRRLGIAVWRCYLVPASAWVVAIGGLALLAPALPTNLWLSMIVKVLFAAAVFSVALMLFERHSARENWELLRQGLRREPSPEIQS